RWRRSLCRIGYDVSSYGRDRDTRNLVISKVLGSNGNITGTRYVNWHGIVVSIGQLLNRSRRDSASPVERRYLGIGEEGYAGFKLKRPGRECAGAKIHSHVIGVRPWPKRLDP